MGMSIEEIKAKLDKSNIDSDTLVELTRYLEGYQKIERIIDDWTKPEEIEWAIREVLEDGQDIIKN